MEIQGEDFKVSYNPNTATIRFTGALRLRGADEYEPIVALMNKAVNAGFEVITLDLQGLRFLNSSGINMLFVYVIHVRDHARSQLVVHGSKQIPWQTKSLKNLKRLMPEVQLELK